MKKLWLSAITAISLMAGSVAQAGDHGRHGGGHDDWNRGHREYRHCDDYDRGRHWGGHHHGYYHRPVVYMRPVVYSRPVYYERPSYYETAYERPAYYGSAYGDGSGEIHGSVTVGF
jgi:Ni/Co efflux regulator RcnB